MASLETSKIAVAYGDGIGPEIMGATLRILSEAGARIQPTIVEIGQREYERGHSAGIAPETWEVLEHSSAFLKAPIMTPQGGGFKSLNVTIRKTLGLYANVRPCVAYAPFVATKHPAMNVVIVRENEEDVYAGIEHRQTEQVMQCLKLITRPGCEKIVRYAFEYARKQGRSKVTCFTKDNIMKLTDGLFHRVFDEIAPEYPDIENDHMIVDIGAAKLADTPEQFDVLVMPNLYGDILSDVAAQIAGSIGLAGTANIGTGGAMFEAIHGSAPDIAGKNLANPSGLLLSSVMMLVHLNQGDVAARIHNGWLKTLEDGQHTGDIWNSETSKARLGTEEFACAVIERLGQTPEHFAPVEYPLETASSSSVSAPEAKASNAKALESSWKPPSQKHIVGVDVFLQYRGAARDLGNKLWKLGSGTLNLTMVTNRGVKVWPDPHASTFCTDHWRCRFMAPPAHITTHWQILSLYARLADEGFDVIKTENLCTFDGSPGYSMGQGQ